LWNHSLPRSLICRDWQACQQCSFHIFGGSCGRHITWQALSGVLYSDPNQTTLAAERPRKVLGSMQIHNKSVALEGRQQGADKQIGEPIRQAP
jgi:hypothetical protein